MATATTTGAIRKTTLSAATNNNPATAAQFPAPFTLPTSKANYAQSVASRLRSFRSDWSDYAVANQVSSWPRDRQLATLLSALGPAVATIYREHLAAGAAAVATEFATTDALLDALELHLLGDAAKRMRRLQLAKQTRYEEEPYGRWLDRLCWYIDDGCAYAERRDDVLLDRIIVGVRNEALSDELCSMGATLTLATAMERVRREDGKLPKLANRQEEPLEMAAAGSKAKPLEMAAAGSKAKPAKLKVAKQKWVPKAAVQAAAASKLVPQKTNAVAVKSAAASKPLPRAANHPAAKAKGPATGPPKAQAKKTQQPGPEPFTAAIDSRKLRSSDVCYQCGNMSAAMSHLANPGECPGYGHLCRRCGGRGHIEFVCRK